MGTRSKNIDPRFDPAFQRGFTRGEHEEEVDAARAVRSVDSFPDDAARSQFAPPPAQPQGAPTTLTSESAPSPTRAPAETAGLAPQSHYVDDAGLLAEIVPVGRGRSLARNPWIYVLWIVGVVAFVGGGVGQLALYGPLYGDSQGVSALYRLMPMIQSIGPAITSLGTFCLAAALLVHALNWMRKNP